MTEYLTGIVYEICPIDDEKYYFLFITELLNDIEL